MSDLRVVVISTDDFPWGQRHLCMSTFLDPLAHPHLKYPTDVFA